MPGYRLEYAASSRAQCKGPKPCHGTKLEKGTLRHGSLVKMPPRGGGEAKDSWSWRHWGCITEKVIENMKKDFPDANDLDGFEDLRPEDQEKIRAAWQNGHVAEEDIPESARVKDDGGDESEGEDGGEKQKKAPAKSKKNIAADVGDATAGEAPKRKRAPPKKKSKETVSDDDDASEVEAPKKKAAPRKKAGETTTKKAKAPAKKRAKKGSDDESGEEIKMPSELEDDGAVDSDVAEKEVKNAKPASKKAGSSKVKKAVTDEEDEEPKPKKKPASKKAPTSKKVTAASASDEEEPKAKKGPTKRVAKKSDAEDEPPKKKRAPARRASAKKAVVDDGGSDDE